MMEEKDFLAQIRKINEKVDIDTEFPDWNKSVQFIIKEGRKQFPFYFVTDGKRVTKVEKGILLNPDVTIEGSQGPISRLFEGDLAIIGAFITKELSITGAKRFLNLVPCYYRPSAGREIYRSNETGQGLGEQAL